MLPYAGYPFSDLGIVSFTYHLYSLIGISYYYQYSGDLEYLQSTWRNFTKGLAWSLSYIDSSGLMNVTSAADWLRVGMGGHVTLPLPLTQSLTKKAEHRSKRNPLLHNKPRHQSRNNPKRHNLHRILDAQSRRHKNRRKQASLEPVHRPLHRQ